jgi:hypothetical protein
LGSQLKMCELDFREIIFFFVLVKHELSCLHMTTWRSSFILLSAISKQCTLKFLARYKIILFLSHKISFLFIFLHVSQGSHLLWKTHKGTHYWVYLTCYTVMSLHTMLANQCIEKRINHIFSCEFFSSNLEK